MYFDIIIVKFSKNLKHFLKRIMYLSKNFGIIK